MKSWQFTETHKPLQFVELPDPVAKPGHVVIDVKACGLCHSDVSALEHESWLRLLQHTPIVLGHEFAGVVSEVGEGVTKFKVGDRVGCCPMLGPDGTGPGYGRDGGYSTKSTAHEDMLVRVPDNISFAQAAAGTDAGMTSYHAMMVAGIKPGMKVGLIGIGGLGQIATRIAVVTGCEVYCASRTEKNRQAALALGATEVAENILAFRKKKLDAIVDFAGAGVTTTDAMKAVKFRGKVVVVGMVEDYANIDTMLLITKQMSLEGSNGGTVDDIAACYQLMAEGKLDPALMEIPLEHVMDGLEMLKAGTNPKRFVAVTKDEKHPENYPKWEF